MKKIVAILIISFAGWHAALGQNVIDNGTFDSDIAGWETTPDSTGIAEWEPVLGQPPGALRLVGADEIALTERCYPAVLGSYYLRTDAYMNTTDDYFLCSVAWAMYASTDCSGSFAFFTQPDIGSWVVNPNQWESLEFDLINVSTGFGTSTKSIRPFLNKFVDFNGDDACIFDNVYLRIVPAVTVPAVSPVGLVLLAAFTVLAGLVVLRRRST